MTLIPQHHRTQPVVALLDANDDTVAMVERTLAATGLCCLSSCHFTDLKKGNVDFTTYLTAHDPAVVIFDIAPPYDENWEFFKMMRYSKAMEKRAVVLTTANKMRLDEIVGRDSTAIEIVGKPYDLYQIGRAIETALRNAEAFLT